MRTLLLALLACLLAACGGTVPGTPATPAPTSAAATTPPAVPLPPRPRTVDVTGIDPCTVLTAGQRKQLGLDQPPSAGEFHSALYNGGLVHTCTTVALDPRAGTVYILLSTVGGIEVYTKRPIRGAVVPIEVHGFPGVQAVQSNHPEFCSVVMDVASGQTLDVQFADGGGQPPTGQTELCARARTSADMAITTLTTALGR